MDGSKQYFEKYNNKYKKSTKNTNFIMNKKGNKNQNLLESFFQFLDVETFLNMNFIHYTELTLIFIMSYIFNSLKTKNMYSSLITKCINLLTFDDKGK